MYMARDMKIRRIIAFIFLFAVFMAVTGNGGEAASSDKVETPRIRALLPDADNGFLVKFSRVEGADGYSVQYTVTDSFKDGSKIELTGNDNTKAVIENLEPGTTVRVRVRAYAGTEKEKNWSSWSRDRSVAIEERTLIRDAKKPYGFRVYSITDDGIRLTWKKLENVNGYEVWRSYHKSYGYVKAAVLERAEEFTWTDTEFDHSKEKVYYYVCSVINNEDGSCGFSSMTGPVEALPYTELKLERESIYMFSGDTRLLETGYGWGSAKGCLWESDDPDVAAVDENGSVTAISAGQAQITCTLPGEKQSASMTVTVDRGDDDPLEEPEFRFRLREDGWYENPSASDTGRALIMMGGDVMALSPQQKACRNEETGYDFRSCFEYVKPVAEKSDLAICNLETLTASEFSYSCEEPYYEGFPIANVSSRYPEAVAGAGFDAVLTANNHNCDAGQKGLFSTLETLDDLGIPHTGSFTDGAQKRYLLFEVNGIRIGLLGYAMAFNGKALSWSEEDADTFLNFYDEEKAKADIQAVRDEGAEFVIVYMHWGTKNFFSTIPFQEEAAVQIAEAGADYIAGGHSHTIQRYDVIETKDGRKVPCIYSMGDFNSHINQITGNRDSVLMCLELIRDDEGRVMIGKEGYIPFYIYTSLDKNSYVTISLDPDWNGGRTDLYKQDAIRTRIADEIGPLIQPFRETYLSRGDEK